MKQCAAGASQKQRMTRDLKEQKAYDSALRFKRPRRKQNKDGIAMLLRRHRSANSQFILYMPLLSAATMPIAHEAAFIS